MRQTVGKSSPQIRPPKLEDLICGDGGTRTLVQTPHRVAFYTFIRPLFFDRGLPDGGPAEAYRLVLGDTQPSRCRADRLK